jgi:hypothetical protein
MTKSFARSMVSTHSCAEYMLPSGSLGRALGSSKRRCLVGCSVVRFGYNRCEEFDAHCINTPRGDASSIFECFPRRPRRYQGNFKLCLLLITARGSQDNAGTRRYHHKPRSPFRSVAAKEPESFLRCRCFHRWLPASGIWTVRL